MLLQLIGVNAYLSILSKGGLVREKDIIEKYFSPLSKKAKGADLLKDDIAVLGNVGSGLMAINMDTLVEGTHFFKNDDPTVLAQKCLRVNLSDLASKGATPIGYFLSLALPKYANEAFVRDFAKGLAIDQANYGMHLMGGDTVKTSDVLTITITLIGLLQSSDVPRRSNAQVGDDVYVTGTIGDGALGLLSHPAYKGKDKLQTEFSRHIGHYLCPEPRMDLAPIISQFVHASMDVSDGLLGDLKTMLKASNLGAEVNINNVPISEETQFILKRNPAKWQTVLTGGDDYEIIFTAAKADAHAIETLSKNLSYPLTKIGSIINSVELKTLNIPKGLGDAIFVSSHSHDW